MNGVVVGRQLRRQPVQRVGEPCADRDECARGTAFAAECVRDQCADRYRRKWSPEPWAMRERHGSLGCKPGDERHGGDDRGDRQHLPAADRLVHVPGGDQHDEHEPARERRLNERQRRVRECQSLQPPARQATGRAQHPAGPPDQLAEQPEPKGTMLGYLARLDRLQPDPGRVQHGGDQCQRKTDDDLSHDRPAR